MTDTPRPVFRLELYLSRLSERVGVADPQLISDERLDEAWNMMNAFVMDQLDALGEEPTDERFREIFIEVCYRLIFREMFTLKLMPIWEKERMKRLGTRLRGVRIKKKGSYDDGDWH